MVKDGGGVGVRVVGAAGPSAKLAEVGKMTPAIPGVLPEGDAPHVLTIAR